MDNGQIYYNRYLEGDEDALVDILREYRDGLAFYINSLVGDIYISEELTLDTFTRLTLKKTALPRRGKLQNVALYHRQKSCHRYFKAP